MDSCKCAVGELADYAEMPLKSLDLNLDRVHVGEVCANVVGRISPKYTLLGDTMNTSSRMESTAPAGYIQLTEDAARLLRAQDTILSTALHERG
jgi:class 3 adenylate cyclase